MALVITVIVLLILASIGIYNGLGTIRSSKYMAFKTELELLQSSVNKIYSENPDNLDEKFISIIKEWNEKKVNDGFILYKYEEEYALLINDDNIYYVKGLKERLRDMIPEQNLPMYIKTVLLPYKNYIVYDSYIQQYKMSFGNGIRKIWDDNYKKMLKENKVKSEL